MLQIAHAWVKQQKVKGKSLKPGVKLLALDDSNLTFFLALFFPVRWWLSILIAAFSRIENIIFLIVFIKPNFWSRIHLQNEGSPSKLFVPFFYYFQLVRWNSSSLIWEHSVSLRINLVIAGEVDSVDFPKKTLCKSITFKTNLKMKFIQAIHIFDFGRNHSDLVIPRA